MGTREVGERSCTPNPQSSTHLRSRVALGVPGCFHGAEQRFASRVSATSLFVSSASGLSSSRWVLGTLAASCRHDARLGNSLPAGEPILPRTVRQPCWATPAKGDEISHARRHRRRTIMAKPADDGVCPMLRTRFPREIGNPATPWVERLQGCPRIKRLRPRCISRRANCRQR